VRCPRCANQSDKVVDSRLTPTGDAIRRRRECEACGHRYTTYERTEVAPLLVVKKNGQREAFHRDKLLAGVLTALHRRPIPADVPHEFVRQVEQSLLDNGVREVSSIELGDRVMDFLREHDQIAFVRFASVYREFRDISDLLDEVRALVDKPESRRA
jgi:transcriptional repressor NrdR